MENLKNFKSIWNYISNQFLRRRSSLLGGTTNIMDCLIALRHLFITKDLIYGKVISKYEQEFANRIGVRFAQSFASGRVGLYGLLKVMDIGTGDEVLLQAPTHIVVPNAIRYTGAKPVFVDCKLDNFNIDLEDTIKKITPKSKVIIIQHTFGIPVEMDKVIELAKEYNLTIIEDCVHALGSKFNGKAIGSFGKAAFFSTEETKTISTTMGGMVVTNDIVIAEKIKDFAKTCSRPSRWLTYRYIIKLIVYHILTQPYIHRYARSIYEFFGNYQPLPQPTNLDELKGKKPENYEQLLSNAQADIGIRQLKRLDENIRHRNMIADLYNRRLIKLGYKIPSIPNRAEPVLVRYPLWVGDRDAAVKKYTPYLVLGTWFSSVLEEAISPEYGGYENNSCPNAEIVSKHLINFPTHSRITKHDVDNFLKILSSLDLKLLKEN